MTSSTYKRCKTRLDALPTLPGSTLFRRCRLIPDLRQASSASSGRQATPPANLLGPQLRLRTLFGAEIVQNLVHLLDTQFA